MTGTPRPSTLSRWPPSSCQSPRQLAARQVEIEVIVRDQPRELLALDADQLLDLLAEDGNDLA
jgi:hypothetical protein